VTITARDYQATALTPAAAPAAAPADPAAAAGEPDPDRIGLVLVHGIGTQQPAETFLDWSAPIVRILTAWRIEHGFAPDPVVRAQFAFSGASQPYLELDVPEVAGHPARRVIVTEAWWAAQIRPPSLGDAAAYVRHGLPRILAGIRDSYAVRDKVWEERLDQELASAEAEGRADEPAVMELRRRGRWAWIDVLDRAQRFLSILAYVPALLLGTLLLLLYVPIRLIPIQAIRDAAILRTVDNFLTAWFGDLPDVLDDPVQAANVRSRLAESIDRLRTQMGCGSIVLVAHSGGAIVSFTTLLDADFLAGGARPLDVQRLITIGQGLALGWRLHGTGRPGAAPLPDRLTGDLVAARPELRWTDFWASYDPAPAGPIEAPAGVTLPTIDSRPVTNRMSVLEDHGGYWDNDEGFIVPLVRYLDEARGEARDSRFFASSVERAVRIERRRQRVGVLALWRWIAALGAVLPIAASTVGAVASAGRVPGPAGLGRDLGAFFERVPFHELVTAPLAFVASLADWPDALVPLGQWLVGTVAIALLFVTIGVVGVRIWSGWDDRERAIARREPLGSVDRRGVAVALAGLTVAAVVTSAWILGIVWA
jgi:hypothetical protein